MFLDKDVQFIRKSKYNIIRQTEYDIELISLETNHYWFIRSQQPGCVVLFHKHKNSDEYHYQQNNPFTSLRHVMHYIKYHDKLILKKI